MLPSGKHNYDMDHLKTQMRWKFTATKKKSSSLF